MSNMGVSAASSPASFQSVGTESQSSKSNDSLPGLIGFQPQNFRRAISGIPQAFKQGGLKIQHAITKICKATKRACVTRFGTRASEDLTGRKQSSSKSELSMLTDKALHAQQPPGAEPELKKTSPVGDDAMADMNSLLARTKSNDAKAGTELLMKHFNQDQLTIFLAADETKKRLEAGETKKLLDAIEAKRQALAHPNDQGTWV